MPKYSVGIQYTVWVDCEADTSADAVEIAVNTEYDVPDHFELQEYEDPIVLLDDERRGLVRQNDW